EQADQGRQVQPALHAAPRDRYRPRQLTPQVRRDELRERGMLTSIVAVPHPNEHQAREECGGKPPRMAESHGNLRSLVCRRSELSPRIPSAGISAQEYNSSTRSNFCTFCAAFWKRLISS